MAFTLRDIILSAGIDFSEADKDVAGFSNRMQANAVKASQHITKAFAKQLESVSRMEVGSKELTKTLQQLKSMGKFLPVESLTKMAGSLSVVDKALEAVTIELGRTNKKSKEFNALVRQKKLLIDLLTSTIKKNTRAQNENNKEQDEANQKTKKGILQIAKWAVGWNLAYGALRVGSRILRRTIRDIVELDEVVHQLRRSLGDLAGAEKSIERIKNSVSNLAAETGKSVKEIGDVAVEFALRGKAVNEIIPLTEIAVKGAVAAFTDQAKIMEFMTVAQNNWGLSLRETALAVDALSAVSKRGSIDTDELVEAFKRSAAVAKQVGLSYQELLAFTAAIAERTQLTGETIGVALRTMGTFVRRPETAKNLEKLTAGFGDLQIEVFDATTGAMKPFGDILRQLGKIWPDLTDKQRANVAMTIAGARQQASFLAIMDQVGTSADFLKDALEAAGTAQEDFDTASRSLSATMSILREEFLAFTKAVLGGESAISDFLAQITTLLKIGRGLASGDFNKFMQENLTKRNVESMHGLANALGTFLSAAPATAPLGSYIKGLVPDKEELEGMQQMVDLIDKMLNPESAGGASGADTIKDVAAAWNQVNAVFKDKTMLESAEALERLGGPKMKDAADTMRKTFFRGKTKQYAELGSAIQLLKDTLADPNIAVPASAGIGGRAGIQVLLEGIEKDFEEAAKHLSRKKKDKTGIERAPFEALERAAQKVTDRLNRNLLTMQTRAKDVLRVGELDAKNRLAITGALTKDAEHQIKLQGLREKGAFFAEREKQAVVEQAAARAELEVHTKRGLELAQKVKDAKKATEEDRKLEVEILQDIRDAETKVMEAERVILDSKNQQVKASQQLVLLDAQRAQSLNKAAQSAFQSAQKSLLSMQQSTHLEMLQKAGVSERVLLLEKEAQLRERVALLLTQNLDSETQIRDLVALRVEAAKLENETAAYELNKRLEQMGAIRDALAQGVTAVVTGQEEFFSGIQNMLSNIANTIVGNLIQDAFDSIFSGDKIKKEMEPFEKSTQDLITKMSKELDPAKRGGGAALVKALREWGEQFAAGLAGAASPTGKKGGMGSLAGILGAGFNDSQFGGGGGGGKFAGLFKGTGFDKSSMIGGAALIGSAILQKASGGDIDYQGLLGGIGTIAGTAIGGPMGGLIGGLAGSLLGSLLGKDKKQVEVKEKTIETPIKLDIANKHLEIISRNIAAIRRNTDPYALPTSFFFRERPGAGTTPGQVQVQSLTVINGQAVPIGDIVQQDIQRGFLGG